MNFYLLDEIVLSPSVDLSATNLPNLLTRTDTAKFYQNSKGCESDWFDDLLHCYVDNEEPVNQDKSRNMPQEHTTGSVSPVHARGLNQQTAHRFAMERCGSALHRELRAQKKVDRKRRERLARERSLRRIRPREGR